MRATTWFYSQSWHEERRSYENDRSLGCEPEGAE